MGLVLEEGLGVADEEGGAGDERERGGVLARGFSRCGEGGLKVREDGGGRRAGGKVGADVVRGDGAR